MATSEAQTIARDLYQTLVSTTLTNAVNQLQAAVPKLDKVSSDEDISKVVRTALPRSAPADIRNFLISLIEQGTLDHLPEVVTLLEAYSAEAPPAPESTAEAAEPASAPPASAGPLSIEVITPALLPEARRNQLAHDLQRLYGEAVQPHFREDETLKGGLILRVRDVESPHRIHGQFSEIIQLVESGSERLSGEITSAVPLNQQQKERIASELRQRYGSRLDLHFTEDETLIGGLIIRIGDQVLDTSLRTRLGAIQRSMMAK